jgi:anti-anti-sigma factor
MACVLPKPVRITEVRRLSASGAPVAIDFPGWFCVQGDEVTVVLGGELDHGNAHETQLLVTRALATGPSCLTIDLRRVVFLDVAAARSLLRGAHDAAVRGCDVAITRPPRLLPLMAATIGIPVTVVKDAVASEPRADPHTSST